MHFRPMRFCFLGFDRAFLVSWSHGLLRFFWVLGGLLSESEPSPAATHPSVGAMHARVAKALPDKGKP
jgi:hypothetical protein